MYRKHMVDRKKMMIDGWMENGTDVLQSAGSFSKQSEGVVDKATV